MPAALSLIAIVTGFGTVAVLWPFAGPWSLATAPFAASLTAGAVAMLAASGAARADGEDEQPALSTDEMVTALRSVLPKKPPAAPAAKGRRAA